MCNEQEIERQCTVLESRQPTYLHLFPMEKTEVVMRPALLKEQPKHLRENWNPLAKQLKSLAQEKKQKNQCLSGNYRLTTRLNCFVIPSCFMVYIINMALLESQQFLRFEKLPVFWPTFHQCEYRNIAFFHLCFYSLIDVIVFCFLTCAPCFGSDLLICGFTSHISP